MEKQLITFDKNKGIFHITNDKISYIIELVKDAYLVHRYWGNKISSYNFGNKIDLKRKTFAASLYPDEPEFSLEFLPQEVPFPHQGDYREPSVQIRMSNGYRISRFKYKSHQITNGIVEIDSLPHARDNNSSFSQTLEINLSDDISQVCVRLFYTIFSDSSVIVRSTKIINEGHHQISVEKLLSASIDTIYDDQSSTTFYGTHQKEFQLNRQSINHGKFSIGSSRGASGPQYPPYISISKDATEFAGDVHSMTLVYSGNHVANLERDQYNHLRMQIGLNPDTFNWLLKPGEEIDSPQALLAFSHMGFNGNSQLYHYFFNNHLIHPNWSQRIRPILINSWEMSYFDVSEQLMMKVIDSAADLGFETVVLDDGWFSGRNNSKTSLGDWQVDNNKFPNGLKPIIDYANSKNLDCGIWFEPEMISPNTKLIEDHPDWVMKTTDYDSMLGRNQYILDLTNIEVQDFIVSTISTYIEKYNFTYVKWDMNRHITEPASVYLEKTRALEFSHRYILSLYKILSSLTEKHPNVLFENCSSGGGRLDAGMLFYMPQTWVSDNTDGLDRQEIQYGASYLFPIYSLTGHVSTSPNHQTNREINFSTRANLASSTNMGYEMDIINITDDEKKQIKQHIEEYKDERKLIKNGDFYRLKSPFSNNESSWMFINKSKTKVILYFFRNTYYVSDLSLFIKIPYVDLEADYRELQSNRIFSGSELAYSGIDLPNDRGDHQTIKVVLESVNDYKS